MGGPGDPSFYSGGASTGVTAGGGSGGAGYTIVEIAAAQRESMAPDVARTVQLARDIQAKRNELMDQAMLLVLSKGWLHAECRIESSHEGWSFKDVLFVDDKPCIDITVTLEHVGDTLNVTTSPRVIAWPDWHPGPFAPRPT